MNIDCLTFTCGFHLYIDTYSVKCRARICWLLEQARPEHRYSFILFIYFFISGGDGTHCSHLPEISRIFIRFYSFSREAACPRPSSNLQLLAPWTLPVLFLQLCSHSSRVLHLSLPWPFRSQVHGLLPQISPATHLSATRKRSLLEFPVSTATRELEFDDFSL